MAQRPFLVFPEPTDAARAGLGGGGIRLHRPSAALQKRDRCNERVSR